MSETRNICYVVLCPCIGANGQGFLLCWYSVLLQPEPLLSKVNAVDDLFCCPALFVQPGLQMISEWEEELKTYYQREVAEGKNPMSILNAVRFKLICRIFSVIKRNEEFKKEYGKVAA